MNIGGISKAIAGAVAGAATGVGTTAIVVPPEIPMPWWGYVAVGLVNAAIGFAFVWVSPANRLR